MTDATETAIETGNPFADAEVIHSYTRAEAIADGVLVELDPAVCHEAGFRYPVAMTAASYAKVVAMTPAAERACNDVAGRLWDVLWMASVAVRRARSSSMVEFKLYAVTVRTRASLVTLCITCGPGDRGEPVLTIGFPGED